VRKESRTLHAKAVDSLVLAVDHFNRAWDRGRTEAVLILLDRSFELLLKAIIVHRAGGSAIREPGKQGMTLGFDHCLRKCLSDAKLKCLDEDDAVALQALNTLRDAAQHYMVEMAEEHLYVHAQSAVTLFGRLAGDVFGRSLADDIPRRILPVCAKVPSGIESMFDIEFADIKRLVAPGSRRRLDAKARLRAMAILQASLDGKKSQPSDGELDRIVNRINKGENWRAIFPGVSTLTIQPDATGPGLAIRITRNKGEAVNLVKDGDTDAAVVAVRRINDTDFYSLGLRDLNKKLGTNRTKLLYFIEREGIQANSEFFKVITVGKVSQKRYSKPCLEMLRARLAEVDLDALWKGRKAGVAETALTRPITESHEYQQRQNGLLHTRPSS
jgi:hypothetical protein